ncbi:OmpA family protein [Tabrizicola aquatica]|uniref:OmpA family protein n=1 Tax=Tabrizicola aquatica TaxID=909926 RepID=UPI000CD27AB1|nr:OmpA family protein [Tabrizicola aquatica]
MLKRAVLVLTLAALPAQAQMLEVEPYAGSEERQGDRIEEAFGTSQRVTGFADGAVLAEPFEGRVSLRRYENPPEKSTLEILENYRQALEAEGLVIDWTCTSRSECGNQSDGGWRGRNGMNLGIGSDVRYLTGTMTFEGAVVHVSVGVETKNHYVQVLQADAMATGQVTVTDAEAMAAAIDAEGRIALDNIYFDFGSALLLPESDAALSEIGRLLADRPDLQVYVVGHTDSVGTLEANLALSRDRAQAVVTALETRFAVAGGRAVPAGVGPLAPVASNGTDAGRALNRRVEIVAR